MRSLAGRPPAPAVLLGPRHAGPPVLVQAPLPRPAELEAGDVAVGLRTGVVRGKPGAQLVAARLLLGRGGQIHGGGHSTRRSDGTSGSVAIRADPPERGLALPRV